VPVIWFLDGGAHRGESIRLAKATYEGQIVAVAVEPAAECWPDLEAEGAILIPAALWSSTGRRPLYLGTNEVSHTLIAEKTTGGISADRSIAVPTVTLGSILRAIPSGERIIVKLDLEGAEYEVLEATLASGLLRWVDELYVDFHADRIRDFSVERHNRLVTTLLDARFPLPKWSPATGEILPWGKRWLL
jgi:FkbM family methyltransferase